MTKTYPGEQWKNVEFNFTCTNQFRIEVSNFGRVRSFNKVSNGNVLKGSMVNGYRILRLKLFRPRDKDTQTRLDYLQKQVLKLAKKMKLQKQNGESEKLISETKLLLITVKKNLGGKFQEDMKKRTIHYQVLIHRLVAQYFLKKPGKGQIIVSHLDHDKLNNEAPNLKWMTPEENYEHQKNDPRIIKEKKEKRYGRSENSKAVKLTVTKVMLLKKLLNQDKTIKQLSKQFKVTGTQILRIKRGENWNDIEAAH